MLSQVAAAFTGGAAELATRNVTKMAANELMQKGAKETQKQIIKEAEKVALGAEKELLAKTASQTGLSSTNAAVPTTFKQFNQHNYRHNLKVLTGQSPARNVDAHHIFPQKFRREFAEVGINIDDPKYLTWWDKIPHSRASKPYENFWFKFLRGEPTKDMILERGKQLTIDSGLDIFF